PHLSIVQTSLTLHYLALLDSLSHPRVDCANLQMTINAMFDEQVSVPAFSASPPDFITLLRHYIAENENQGVT
ncbi:MAG: hypothetical protein KBT06_11415, partial [Prevotellaceae bacterium]|nr:hypothetical protein [Candidatus Colivivens equi]